MNVDEHGWKIKKLKISPCSLYLCGEKIIKGEQENESSLLDGKA
jgi:uncharacterized protein YlaI